MYEALPWPMLQPVTKFHGLAVLASEALNLRMFFRPQLSESTFQLNVAVWFAFCIFGAPVFIKKTKLWTTQHDIMNFLIHYMVSCMVRISQPDVPRYKNMGINMELVFRLPFIITWTLSGRLSDIFWVEAIGIFFSYSASRAFGQVLD